MALSVRVKWLNLRSRSNTDYIYTATPAIRWLNSAQDSSVVGRSDGLDTEQTREPTITNTLLPANTKNFSRGWVLDGCFRHDINEGGESDKPNFNERYLFLFVIKQDIAKKEGLTAGLLLTKVSRQPGSDEDYFRGSEYVVTLRPE